MTPVPVSLRCRGMRDLSADEMARFRQVEQAFRAICESWGFREIRTPVIEHLHLFTNAGTLSPQMLGRVYSFHDWDGWSGERVVLRPDATIPTARLYCEQFSGHVAKLFYVENIFRFAVSEERREVWQCGAEIVGDTWPLGDIEAISIVLRVLRELGFSAPVVRLSHTGVVRSILATAGYTPSEQLALYDRMLDGDLSVFAEIQARLPQIGAPLGLLADVTGGRTGAIDNLRSAFAAGIPLMREPLDELNTIAATLDARGCTYELDLTMVRDFEYYTGPVFHVVLDGQTVAGGGRYDGLIAALDVVSMPACGFAIFIEPVTALLQTISSEPSTQPVQVEAATAAPSGLARAVEVVNSLQAQGVRAALILPGEEAGSRWRVEVQPVSEAVRYRLEDRAAGTIADTESMEQVIATLKRGAAS
jgi:histidyl-tRNA synthetase